MPSEGWNLHSGSFWQGLTDGGAAWVDWVHVASQEQLLFACDGRIYRLHGWRDVPPAQYMPRAAVVADLRDARFTLMQAPPEALRW